jgi:uncharacterized protein (DUF58 family)
MAFSEVREYRYGDDIRNIDWNVTARTGTPHIKVYEEERELTVMLLIDVSGSRFFGTSNKLKKDLATELAAVLAFSAGQNNDKVGAIFFSDRVEKFIPPKKGRSHTLRIIRELLYFEPIGKQTNIGEALRYLSNAIKKRCTAFVLSDMLDMNEKFHPLFEDALKIAGNKHDLGVIRLVDPREIELPNVGIIDLEDAETGETIWIDTASGQVRNSYKEWWIKADASLKQTLSKCKVDHVQITTAEDYVKPLVKLFKQR